jgi:hypothetical protein
MRPVIVGATYAVFVVRQDEATAVCEDDQLNTITERTVRLAGQETTRSDNETQGVRRSTRSTRLETASSSNKLDHAPDRSIRLARRCVHLGCHNGIRHWDIPGCGYA